REAQLHTHQRVRIAVIEGQIIITPMPDKPLTLEERLDAYDPERHGGEAMVTMQRLGAEQW
ncbi:PbsX family transcriptional regulator, partial [Methylovulum sp.]